MPIHLLLLLVFTALIIQAGLLGAAVAADLVSKDSGFDVVCAADVNDERDDEEGGYVCVVSDGRVRKCSEGVLQMGG